MVATRKDPRLEGKKLLILKPVSPEGKDEAGYVISVEYRHAGNQERVIAVAGSSARMWRRGCKEICPSIALLSALSTMSIWINELDQANWIKYVPRPRHRLRVGNRQRSWP